MLIFQATVSAHRNAAFNYETVYLGLARNSWLRAVIEATMVEAGRGGGGRVVVWWVVGKSTRGAHCWNFGHNLASGKRRAQGRKGFGGK